MQEQQTPETERSVNRSGISPARFLGFAFCLGLLVFAAFWFLPKPKTTETPVTYSRNDDGSYTARGDEPSAGMLAIKAAQLKAQNNISTMSSSTNSGADFFASESIVVINPSDDLLMKRAADRLVEVLKENGSFETVAHQPAGYWPVPGERKFDLYVVLDLKRIAESGGASKDLEADVLVHFGPSILDSSHSYSNTLDPPTFAFRTAMELEHKSTMNGVESSSSRGTVQGKSIGDALANRVLEELKGHREKEMPMPQLPGAFYPDYEPAPQLPFLSEFDAEEKFSFCGCCISNETFWFINNAVAQDLMKSSHELLSGLGWKGNLNSDDNTRYLRMTNGEAAVEIYPARSARNLAPSERGAFRVRYRKVLSRDRRRKIYESMLAADPPDVDLLLVLRRMADRSQRERLLDLVEKNPPSTFDAWFELATRYFERKEHDKAIAASQCAALVQRIANNGGSGKIDELVKKNKIDGSARDVSQAALDALGVRCLLSGEAIELPLRIGKPHAVAVAKPDGKFRVFGVTLSDSKRGTNAEFEYEAVELGENASSWTRGVVRSGEAWQHRFSDDGGWVVFQLDEERSKFIVQAKEAN